MRTAPPRTGSIVDPAPHQAAQRDESVKNRKTVSGVARITIVRSSACGNVAVIETPSGFARPLRRADAPAAAGRFRSTTALLEFGRDLQPPERVAPHVLEHLAHRPQRLRPRAIEA